MNDHYLIPLILFGSLVLIMFVFTIGSFMIIQKQKQQRAKIEQRETEQRYQNELLNVKLEVQENALNMVSREIHDNVGQELSIVRMQLFNASRAASLEMAKELCTTATELLGNSITELRNLSHVLNGEMIARLGLIAAIQKELVFVNAVYPAQGSLTLGGDEIQLSDEQDLLLFRIVQQAIGNIHRHANATEYTIDIRYHAQKIAIVIRDNGEGFKNTDGHQPSGIGLINISERARMLGGEVSFGNNPDRGAYVQLSLNLL